MKADCSESVVRLLGVISAVTQPQMHVAARFCHDLFAFALEVTGKMEIPRCRLDFLMSYQRARTESGYTTRDNRRQKCATPDNICGEDSALTLTLEHILARVTLALLFLLLIFALKKALFTQIETVARRESEL